MSAIHRILAALPNSANKPSGPKWIEKVEQKQKGKPKNSANDLPEGTFELDPGGIAQALKMHSKDFQQAIQRLQFYINRAGDNLGREEELKMERAKEALYRAYGREIPEK